MINVLIVYFSYLYHCTLDHCALDPYTLHNCYDLKMKVMIGLKDKTGKYIENNTIFLEYI